MKKRIEPIEIKEPAIQEIQKKKSCFGRSCSFGCLLFLLLIVGGIILIRFSAISHPKEVKQIPEHFPKSVPIYDKDAITKITFLSGKKKERAVQTAAKLPDFVSNKLISLIDKSVGDQEERGIPSTWNEFLYMFENDIRDERDTATIYWEKLTAEPKFIQDYYKINLERAGFLVNDDISDDKTIRELYFIKDTTEGTLYIEDAPTSSGTDSIILTTLFSAK